LLCQSGRQGANHFRLSHTKSSNTKKLSSFARHKTILRTREARRRPRGELAGRAGSSATRGRRRRRGVADFLVRDGDGFGGARWRSPRPLRLRYGADVDSTRLEQAHGLFSRADSLSQILHRFIHSRGSAARRARSVIIGNKATANQSPLPRLSL
jgi:hypothetical protein